MASERPPNIPILAHLTNVEAFGDLNENDEFAGRNYSLRISVDGEKFVEQSEKPVVRRLQWKWQDLQVLILPTSLLEFEIYCETSLEPGFFEKLVGKYEGKVYELLDKDDRNLLKDKTGTMVEPHVTIRISLSSNPNDQLEGFIESLKADVVSMPNRTLETERSATLALGPSLQAATKYRDIATEVNPLLSTSWMLLFVAYKAVKEKRGSDEGTQDLASMLQGLLVIAQSIPKLTETSDIINVAKEISRVSEEIASNVHKPTRSDSTERTSPRGPMSDMKSRLEHLAELLGDLIQLNQYLVEHGADERSEGSILAAASGQGHEDIVRLLLESRGNADAHDEFAGDALVGASKGGHERIVKLLLAKGINADIQGEYEGDALVEASGGGHEGIVELLLENMVNLDEQERNEGDALIAASSTGHEGIVQLLLGRGRNADSRGEYKDNALIAASIGGHEGVVKLLLAMGADTNAQNDSGDNALAAALTGGHGAIVNLLLERAENPNAEESDQRPPITATDEDEEKLMKRLLNMGADIIRQKNSVGVARAAASNAGLEATVNMLLDGAEYEGDSLITASIEGHEEVVRLLLETGADVNARGGIEGNALIAASSRGHEDIVKLLLEKGADVNAQAGLNGNALAAAASRGYEEIVTLLIDNGADVNAEGGRDGNALVAASSGGHEDTVKLLLEKAANADVQIRCEGEALVTASSMGYEAIVKLLLEKGTNADAQGQYEGEALVAASRGNHEGSEGIVKLLLEKGTNPIVQGEYKPDAFFAALEKGREGILRLLLQKATNAYIQGKHEDDELVAALSGARQVIPGVVTLLEKGEKENLPGYDSYGNVFAPVSSRSHEGMMGLLIELQSGTYPPYASHDHDLDDGLYGDKVQPWSQKENEAESAVYAQLPKTDTMNAESSSVDSPSESVSLVKPTIRWLAAERALRHAQNQYQEVIQVFATYEIPESDLSVYAGFDEDLIKSGVGYLEQIHIFASLDSSANPPKSLLLELGQLLAPFSAALFTETSVYEIPVPKHHGEIWEFGDLVQAAASKFVEPTGYSLSGETGSSGHSLPGGFEKGDGEEKKSRSRKGKERDRGDGQDNSQGESDDDDPSGDPIGPGSGSGAVEPPMISFQIVSELYSVHTQDNPIVMQDLTVLGKLTMQNEPLNRRRPRKYATSQVAFKQLVFGTTRRSNASYKQYYTRVIVDSRQQTADIIMVKPKRTKHSDNEAKDTVSSKDATSTNIGLSFTAGLSPQATLTGGKTKTKEKTIGFEQKRYTNQITQQQKYGVVRWGFDVDDPSYQKEGADMAEGDLPSVKFEFLGKTETPAPPPEQIDVEISAYWHIPKPIDKKKPRWPWSKSGPQTVTYSNLCQIVTLAIPSNSRGSDYQATLKVDPTTSTQHQMDVHREVGETGVTPGVKTTQHDFASSYDYWKQDSNLELRTLPHTIVMESMSRGNRNANSASSL